MGAVHPSPWGSWNAAWRGPTVSLPPAAAGIGGPLRATLVALNAPPPNPAELQRAAAIVGDYELWRAAWHAQAEARQQGERCGRDVAAALLAWRDAGTHTLMVKGLIADGRLPPTIGEALIRAGQQDTARRNARHTGAPPKKQEEVAHALQRVFADPTSGLDWAAVKAGRVKWDVVIWLLEKHQGLRPDRRTLKRAIEALAAGKFGGVPP